MKKILIRIEFVVLIMFLVSISTAVSTNNGSIIENKTNESETQTYYNKWIVTTGKGSFYKFPGLYRGGFFTRVSVNLYDDASSETIVSDSIFDLFVDEGEKWTGAHNVTVTLFIGISSWVGQKHHSSPSSFINHNFMGWAKEIKIEVNN